MRRTARLSRALSLLLGACLCLSAFAFAGSFLSEASAPNAGSEGFVSLELNGFDTECRTGFAVIYTKSGEKTGTNEKCVDIVVGSDGVVRAVESNDQTVPEDGFVLSGSGAKAKTLKTLKAGDGVWVKRSGDAGTVTLVTKDYDPFSESSIKYSGRNRTRAQDLLIIYDTGTTTNTNEWGYEVSVDKNGTVISVGGNNSPIPEGGFVLSGHGVSKTALEEAAQTGMTVSVDPDAMTVSFRMDGKAVGRAYELRTEEAKKRMQSASEAYAVFDGKDANARLEKLKELTKTIGSALSADDRVKLGLAELEYASELKAFDASLNEKEPAELRGVWIRPDLNADKASVLKTVSEIYEAGFNQVYIEILFDSTLIYPPSEGSLYEQNPKLAGFDLLQAYIDACHAYRIELHAWYSVMRVGHTGSANTPKGVAAKKPEWRNIQKNGKDTVTNEYGSAYFLNPALPEVREFLLGHAKDLMTRYNIDGLHLDYIRYPNNAAGEDFGYDETTKKLFKEKYGKDVDGLATGHADFVQFRADFVTEVVRSISRAAKELRPDLYLSAAVAPGFEGSLRTHQQDTRTWVKEGLLDILMPMAYGTSSVVEKYTKEARDLIDGSGKAVYLLPGVSDYGSDVFIEQTEAIRKNGGDGVAFFSWSPYRGKYAEASERLFGTKTASPTWNASKAIVSRLKTIEERLSGPMKDLPLEKLVSAVTSLKESIKANGKDDLSAKFDELQSAFDSLPSSVPANAKKALAEDLNAVKRIRRLDRDEAKEAYLATHPLPDSLRPEDLSQDGQTDASGNESGESSAPEKTPVELNLFEKIMQVAAMVILIGGILLLPLYYVLYRRRKKIIQSFSEQEPGKDPEENSGGTDANSGGAEKTDGDQNENGKDA